MFKSYCATMYCLSMWFDSTVTTTKKLKIAYNHGFRGLLSSSKNKFFKNKKKYDCASDLFVNLNIPSLINYYVNLCSNLKNRIMNSNYLLVNGIVRSATHSFACYEPSRVTFST